MKTLRYIIGLIALCACSTPLRIYTDYDPDYDQWRYATYSLRMCSEPLDSAHEQIVRSCVINELEQRGYTIDDQKPDFLLRYYTLTDDHTVVSPALAGYFLGPYWMRTRTHKYIDKEETIMLDLMDSNSGHVVWKGWVATTFHSQKSQRELGKIIRRSITIMFKDFPRATRRHTVVGSLVNKQ